MAEQSQRHADDAVGATAHVQHWQALGTDVLTEATARVDVAQLEQLGYVVRRNPNGTVTFWHPECGSEAHEPAQRQARIQQLIAMGVLRDGE